MYAFPSRFATLDRAPLVVGARIKSGDRLAFVAETFFQPEGEPEYLVDLTGYEFEGFVSRQSDSVPLLPIAVDTSHVSEGRFGLSLTPEQTASLTPGTYRWRVVWNPPDDDYPLTVLSGALEIMRP